MYLQRSTLNNVVIYRVVSTESGSDGRDNACALALPQCCLSAQAGRLHLLDFNGAIGAVNMLRCLHSFLTPARCMSLKQALMTLRTCLMQDCLAFVNVEMCEGLLGACMEYFMNFVEDPAPSCSSSSNENGLQFSTVSKQQIEMMRLHWHSHPGSPSSLCRDTTPSPSIWCTEAPIQRQSPNLQ